MGYSQEGNRRRSGTRRHAPLISREEKVVRKTQRMRSPEMSRTEGIRRPQGGDLVCCCGHRTVFLEGPLGMSSKSYDPALPVLGGPSAPRHARTCAQRPTSVVSGVTKLPKDRRLVHRGHPGQCQPRLPHGACASPGPRPALLPLAPSTAPVCTRVYSPEASLAAS